MNAEHDDSFELALATMDLPTSAKVPKLDASNMPTKDVLHQPNSNSLQENRLNKADTTTKSAAPNPYCILVHTKQRGNPILKSIQNVPLEFRSDIIPDYIVGRTTCILFLSLKYHNLNPDYICQRLKELGKHYELRVLLVQVDTPEPHNALKSLTRISLLADLTLMLAWNAEEAGKIIETYKLFEKRGPDLIKERVESNPHQKVSLYI